MSRGTGGGGLAALLLAAVLGVTLPATARAADPELAAAASLLIPGAGQAANGDWGAGAVHLGLYTVLASRYTDLSDDPGYIEPEDREDDATNTIRINETTFKADLYGTAASNVALYSAFGAYRDARALEENALGYGTPRPQESLGDLALAPYSWTYLARPTTWVPLLVPLSLALSKPADDQLVYAPDDTITRSELRRGFFVMHTTVGIGEEAFFRGVLNNGFSDWLGPGWGLAASSAVFGVAHSGNAGTANPGVATLYGLYLGWLHQRNDYAIGQGVAIHFWWNFLVAVALTNQRESTAQVPLLDVYLRF